MENNNKSCNKIKLFEKSKLDKIRLLSGAQTCKENNLKKIWLFARTFVM